MKRASVPLPIHKLPYEMGTMIEMLGVPHSEEGLELYCSNRNAWGAGGAKSLLLFARWREEGRVSWREVCVDAEETVQQCVASMRQGVPAVRGMWGA